MKIELNDEESKEIFEEYCSHGSCYNGNCGNCSNSFLVPVQCKACLDGYVPTPFGKALLNFLDKYQPRM